MKKLIISGIVLLTAWFAQAQVTESFTYVNGTDFSAIQGSIPDGNNSGTVVVANSPWTITQIDDIQVELNIAGAPAGGFAGDLYVQLTHAGGLSVLLNRPGRTLSNPVGHFDGGLATFVLDDAAAVNSHDYPTLGNLFAQVGGTFQPDGRTTDPLLVLDTDVPNPGASLLGAFSGLDPVGDWNLLLVDNQGGTGNMTLDSFTITVTDNSAIAEVPIQNIVSTVIGGGTATLGLQGNPGRSYTVEFAENVLPGPLTWTPVTGSPFTAGPDGQFSVTHTIVFPAGELYRATFP